MIAVLVSLKARLDIRQWNSIVVTSRCLTGKEPSYTEHRIIVISSYRMVVPSKTRACTGLGRFSLTDSLSTYKLASMAGDTRRSPTAL